MPSDLFVDVFKFGIQSIANGVPAQRQFLTGDGVSLDGRIAADLFESD